MSAVPMTESAPKLIQSIAFFSDRCRVGAKKDGEPKFPVAWLVGGAQSYFVELPLEPPALAPGSLPWISTPL